MKRASGGSLQQQRAPAGPRQLAGSPAAVGMASPRALHRLPRTAPNGWWRSSAQHHARREAPAAAQQRRRGAPVQALPSPDALADVVHSSSSVVLALPPPVLPDLGADASGRLFIPGLIGDNQLREGFISGLALIFFSEIGDKTFFIALLLALRYPQLAVFTGTFGALAIMTVISVLLGQTLHLVDEAVPLGDTALGRVPWDDLLAAALLIWFGVQTLREAGDASNSAAEEKEEAEEVVGSIEGQDLSKLVLTTFTLVFAAEWGDKSFLATIALAAASNPLGVTGGAVAGHGVATALAVAGGQVLTKYVSPTLLQYLGGSLFLVFAAATLIDVAVDFGN